MTTPQCPHCAELDRLTKAYESAERKAADHEADLIRLRTEQTELLATVANLHEYIAQLRGEREAEYEALLASHAEQTRSIDQMQAVLARAIKDRDDAIRMWMSAVVMLTDVEDENALLRASRARLMRALKTVMARHAALLHQRIILGAVRGGGG